MFSTKHTAGIFPPPKYKIHPPRLHEQGSPLVLYVESLLGRTLSEREAKIISKLAEGD